MKQLTRITNEEIFKLQEDFFGEGSCSPEIDDSDLSLKIAQAQLEADQVQMRAAMESVFEKFNEKASPQRKLESHWYQESPNVQTAGSIQVKGKFMSDGDWEALKSELLGE